MGKLRGALFGAGNLTVLAAVFALTGCTVSAPDAGDSASGTSTKPVTAAPVEIDCDTLLLPAAYEDFEARGMQPFAFSTWNDNMQFMADSDGLVCEQGVPNSGQVAVFATLEMTSEQWDAKKSDLIKLGASETNNPISGYLQEPDVDVNVSRGGYVFGDGRLYYVSSDHLAQWIPQKTN
ncbi:MAG: hypothetical protein H7201_18225 [Candidatus Saccharibacteria bacterium]|nr:hypothetical protein [Microbacteriaceae bacterium]